MTLTFPCVSVLILMFKHASCWCRTLWNLAVNTKQSFVATQGRLNSRMSQVIDKVHQGASSRKHEYLCITKFSANPHSGSSEEQFTKDYYVSVKSQSSHLTYQYLKFTVKYVNTVTVFTSCKPKFALPVWLLFRKSTLYSFSLFHFSETVCYNPQF